MNSVKLIQFRTKLISYIFLPSCRHNNMYMLRGISVIAEIMKSAAKLPNSWIVNRFADSLKSATEFRRQEKVACHESCQV